MTLLALYIIVCFNFILNYVVCCGILFSINSSLPYFTEYTDDEAQIQKHSSVIVRRIPIGGVKPSGKTYIVYVYFTKCFLFCPRLKNL